MCNKRPEIDIRRVLEPLASFQISLQTREDKRRTYSITSRLLYIDPALPSTFVVEMQFVLLVY